MANTTLTQFPSGQTQYKINFDYLARQFVVVTLINSADPAQNKVLTAGNDYRFLNPTTIEIIASQTGFNIVQIHRFTSTDLVVEFRDGSVLTASDLTNAELQAIHIAEEGRDQTTGLAKQYADQAVEAGKDAQDILNQIVLLGKNGYTPVGSFEAGGTLNLQNDVLQLGSGASVTHWRWEGTLPKVVPPGSTPESTGGIARGKWVDVTDATLRGQLSGSLGASLVKTSSGETVEEALDALGSRLYTPEDFGCSTSATDNSTAINLALGSGKHVVWDGSKTYKVTNRLQAKPEVYDNHTGVMSLDVSRYNLGMVKVAFADKVKESDPIRGMYVESAYDFAELAFIKAMGINTLIHYGNFNVEVDNNGSLTKVADNVRALGMRLMVNTEVRDVKDPTLTLGQFIQKFNSHPAVFAWSTFDEAMSRDIPYADQKAHFDAIRSYSNKPISLVDSWNGTDIMSKKMLEYYDIVLADPYGWQHTGMTTAQAVETDLKRFRKSFGLMQAHSRQKAVIPVLGLTIGNGAPGATDAAQVISLAENFRKAGNGQFVFFVWDGLGDPAAIISGIRGNAQFISCVKSTVEKRYPVPVVTESFLFGGSSATSHHSLNNIIDRIPPKDPNTSDPYIGGYAWPIHIFGGAAVNTDRGVTTPGWNISGIGHKSTASVLVTDIPFREHVIVYGGYSVVDAGVLNGVFQVLGTFDGGYTSAVRATQDVSGTYAMLDIQATTPDPRERVCFRTTSVTDSSVYRRIQQGVLISCGW